MRLMWLQTARVGLRAQSPTPAQKQARRYNKVSKNLGSATGPADKATHRAATWGRTNVTR